MSDAKSKQRRYGRWVGKTLAGKYWIRNIVGVGGNGIVYEADDRAFGRRVVVKLPKARASAFTLMRFRREARAGSSIDHPHVCAFHELGILDDGTPFLVMERLVGETLSTRLARENVIPLHVSVHIMRQALAGLGAAHASGLVHRDLKPGNIFLTQLAEPFPTAKVLDFGLSIFNEENDERPDEVTDLLTAVGTVVGTPRYMSPEQVRGHRDFDPRVDVFACGAIIYEMITGQRAFSATGTRELFEQILECSPPPPSQLNRVIPRSVDLIVAKALARERESRYASAAAFADALGVLAVFSPTPVVAYSTLIATSAPATDRQAYLQSRFRELVNLRQQASEPSVSSAPARTSSIDIPVYCEDSANAPRIPNLIPPDEDPDGTAPTKPKRNRRTGVGSSTERTVPASTRRPRRS
jgi:serine/threonine protein kinase